MTLTAGELAAGDTIDVIYADTAGGSRGTRAAIVSTEPEPILVCVDRDGSGTSTLVAAVDLYANLVRVDADARAGLLRARSNPMQRG